MLPPVPMTRARVLVALATTGRVPKAIREGKVSNVPPPATALIAPAPTAEPTNPTISHPVIIMPKRKKLGREMHGFMRAAYPDQNTQPKINADSCCYYPEIGEDVLVCMI